MYTYWQRCNYWKLIRSVIETDQIIRYEADHLSIAQMADLKAYMISKVSLDIAPATRTHRLKKKLQAEIELIRLGAATADVL